MKNDEAIAILRYEEKLLAGKRKATAHSYVGPEETKDRVVLAVFRHVIENILQWSPEVAFANMSMELIHDLLLVNEWKNLSMPREINQFKTAKYVVARLYPKKFMKMFSPEALTLQVYRTSLEQRHGVFPKGYFLEAEGHQRAETCLRYMLSNYVIYPNVETMYKEFADDEMIFKLLHDYALNHACLELYNNPLDYLHAALPKKQKDELAYHYYRFIRDEKMYDYMMSQGDNT